MAELLPTRQAQNLVRAVSEYITTSISLADQPAKNALAAFLEGEDGIVIGPYLRARTPYRPSAEYRAQSAYGGGIPPARPLSWLPAGFTPYVHQENAFRRLTSNPTWPGGQRDGAGLRIPAPTLVTTGTGSGKTESFLYPVLDHVARARRMGISGTKALLLYPMNALASDQAGRLAGLISEHPQLSGITAALYTGEAGTTARKAVDKDGLITDRETIRNHPPDIILTNYKMLDQMLLRAPDHRIWRASATNLRYLVLDEFHTYDGAQGTDVAMLIRRLRRVLEHHAPSRESVHLVPVATSATLGGSGQQGTDTMREFAQTVFGCDFPPESVVGEDRLSVAEVCAAAGQRLTGACGEITLQERTPSRTDGEKLAAQKDPAALTDALLETLWIGGRDWLEGQHETPGYGTEQKKTDLILIHPRIKQLLTLCASPAPLARVSQQLFKETGWEAEERENAVSQMLAALGHLRKNSARGTFPSFETHLWLRELTRLDRAVRTDVEYRWSDDNRVLDDEPALPAIYCRFCGRSGWACARKTSSDEVETDPHTIRQASIRDRSRVIAMIAANAAETEAAAPQTDIALGTLHYYDPITRSLSSQPPEEETGYTVNVIAYGKRHEKLLGSQERAEEAGRDQTCPACGAKDAIRYIGAGNSTLLSVALSALFGDADLDTEEKKALVFTDSVQDAAHRAGFVQSRSHTLTMRNMTCRALTEEPQNIDAVATRLIAQAETAADGQAREYYRLLPPALTEVEVFQPLIATDGAAPSANKRKRERALELLHRRLSFDITREAGMQSGIGRTLYNTHAVLLEVRAEEAELRAVLAAIDSQLSDSSAQDGRGRQEALSGLSEAEISDSERLLWIRGVLERIRAQGGIHHAWLKKFRENGGRMYDIWGGRPDREIMPALSRGRSVPEFPAIGKLHGKSLLIDAQNPGSWYVDYTRRALKTGRADAAHLVGLLLKELAAKNILEACEYSTNTQFKGKNYAIPQGRLTLRALTAADLGSGDAPSAHVLLCDTCHSLRTSGSALVGAKCLTQNCPGNLRAHFAAENFYRRLYGASDMHRLVAREHSSLLDATDRLAYEEGFKKGSENPGSPNVLVATPTLEMGIDIGDLSHVILGSFPPSVASYLQRVGRAGRLTGNALNLVLAPSTRTTLGILKNPETVLDGEVRAPATYLRADELLKRQYIAYLLDQIAARGDVARQLHREPRTAQDVLADTGQQTLLGLLNTEAEREDVCEDFIASFGTHLSAESATNLRTWAKNRGVAEKISRAAQAWKEESEALSRRLKDIQEQIQRLENNQFTPLREEKEQLKDDLHLLGEEEKILQKRQREHEEGEKRSLISSKVRTRQERSEIDNQHWIGSLERYGLLPNFTLVDDTAEVVVTLNWRDHEQEWCQLEERYERGVASAITELAPGAHFYAHGTHVQIDSIDLGSQSSRLKKIAICAKCGYVNVATSRDATMPPCGGCGDRGVKDPGQQLETVEMRQVYANAQRYDSRINDATDNRERVHFTTAHTVHLEADKAARIWESQGNQLAVMLHRNHPLSEFNLGRDGEPTSRKVTLNGEERPVPGFKICPKCGHLDAHNNKNMRREHQVFCPHRNSAQVEKLDVVISRTIETDTLLISLPSGVSARSQKEAMPSLRAALELGLREHFGGAPGHIRFVSNHDPIKPDAKALLLYDAVPGGTGYLVDLAEPETLRHVMTSALETLENCPCQGEQLQSCHRCLQAYGAGSDAKLLNRQMAATLLQEILGEGEWELSEQVSRNTSGSALEIQFRELMRNIFTRQAAGKVRSKTGQRGETISANISGVHFTLEEQIDLHGTRPDFLLRWQGSTVRENLAGIAIYTDGYQYHATVTNDRAADDAEKRAVLRENGYLVLAITHADITAWQKTAAENNALLNGQRVSPDWRGDNSGLGATLGAIGGSIPVLTNGAFTREEAEALLTGSAINLLVAILGWVSSGRDSQGPGRELQPMLKILANTCFLLLCANAKRQTSPGADTEQSNTALVQSGPFTARYINRTADAPGAGIGSGTGEYAAYLSLDGNGAYHSDFRSYWGEWLHLANLLQGLGVENFNASATRAEAGAGVGGGVQAGAGVRAGTHAAEEAAPSEESTGPEPAEGTTEPAAAGGTRLDLPADWANLQTIAQELECLAELSAIYSAGLPKPVMDEEVAGYPVDFTWPEHHLALLVEEDQEVADALNSEGWQVYTATGPAVYAEIARHTGSEERR
ncbi:DEAD/DEAH box helicase [Dermabacteraceae bacterium P13147]